jgi:hypothetical protein
MSDKFPQVNVRSGGLGLFGWLIILGIFGIGPCNSCMSGCGPQVDGKKIIEQLTQK